MELSRSVGKWIVMYGFVSGIQCITVGRRYQAQERPKGHATHGIRLLDFRGQAGRSFMLLDPALDCRIGITGLCQPIGCFEAEPELSRCPKSCSQSNCGLGSDFLLGVDDCVDGLKRSPDEAS